MKILQSKNAAASSISAAIAVIMTVVIGGVVLLGIIGIVDSGTIPYVGGIMNDKKEITSELILKKENEVLLGDINEDGYVDNLDVSYLENLLQGYPGYDKNKEADINEDLVVDNKDLSLLKNIVKTKE